ncbi:MAG: ankyrin repeat domain-containing protein [Legionella sp.]|uniref:ankyrin repeat domain-containing protein n=1 Tax=Legionella sp. TaxID=459 RepID=UPI0039E55F03
MPKTKIDDNHLNQLGKRFKFFVEEKKLQKIHVIGIKAPRRSECFDFFDDSLKRRQVDELLDLICKVIQSVPDDTNQLNIIVLPENAFTPFPIESKNRVVILDRLQAELNKKNKYKIMLIPGSFDHYKLRKTDQKARERIKKSLAFYNLFPNEKYCADEVKYITSILESDLQEIEGKENTAYILLSNSDDNNEDTSDKKITKRDKNVDFMEKNRFDPTQNHIKQKTVFLVGQLNNSVQKIKFKNDKEIKVALTICLEQSLENSPIVSEIEKNQPDIQIIISDYVNLNRINHGFYGDVIICMDSKNGLYIENIKNNYDITTAHYDFKFDNSILLDASLLNNTLCRELMDDALLDAVSQGNLLKVQLCLNKGANIDYYKFSKSSLYVAAEGGYYDIVKFLIEKGAKINAKSIEGDISALSIATKRGHLEIVRCLVESGADIADIDDNGFTPLQVAAYEGNIGIVDYLINHGACINEKDQLGNTPLLLAISNNKLEMVKYLVKYKADLSKNLVEIAKQHGHLNIVEYLQSIEIDNTQAINKITRICC